MSTLQHLGVGRGPGAHKVLTELGYLSELLDSYGGEGCWPQVRK